MVVASVGKEGEGLGGTSGGAKVWLAMRKMVCSMVEVVRFNNKRG